MNREKALHEAAVLGTSPAATWISNRLSDDRTKLVQKCLRCGTEKELEFSTTAIAAFQRGTRGDALAKLIPAGFDEALFMWKRKFQLAYEGCSQSEAA